jgi:quercetin dioxygenase-like cupin family protein
MKPLKPLTFVAILLLATSTFADKGFVLKAGSGEQLINGIVAKVSPKTGAEQSILAEQTFPVGGTTGLHIHDQGDEIFYIVEGRGTAILGEATHPIAKGDTIFIPRGTPHGVANPATPEDLVVVFFMDSPELVHQLRAIREMFKDNPAHEPTQQELKRIESIGGSRRVTDR